MTTGPTPMEAAERLVKAMRSIAGKNIPIRFPDDETAMLFAVIVENAGTCARALLDRRTSGTEAALREKALELLADYRAGRPLQVIGDGWLIRFAACIAALSPNAKEESNG